MTARMRSDAGYTMIELLISTAIMITITGAIFSLVNPAQGTSQTQPEAADLQQRMRVANDALFKELVMAGAGPYQGPVRGALVDYFAPIMPRRTGRTAPDDPEKFREDAITLTYIPNTYSQTTISQDMPTPSAELKVSSQSNCPGADQLCGFKEDMEVMIFDTSGNFDTFTITEVQGDAAHLQHRQQDLSKPYNSGASITQVKSSSYYLDRTTNQIMQDDGGGTVMPVVDNVVDLRFEYFGDPNPPTKPQPIKGEANCLYDAAGNYLGGATLPADEGSLASLNENTLTDGPWCGGGTNRYDADLMRIRKVRVSLRLQVASVALRGVNTMLFRNPGGAKESARQIPDYLASFEVTPRNMNLTR